MMTIKLVLIVSACMSKESNFSFDNLSKEFASCVQIWFEVHPVCSCLSLLGAICGSARSMDLAVQSMDPYFAQESMDHAR